MKTFDFVALCWWISLDISRKWFEVKTLNKDLVIVLNVCSGNR